MTDEYYMQACLALAEEALESGNPPVGAILVVDEKIIAQGIESVKPSGDVTNHAEIVVIRNAIEAGYVGPLSQATMYSTHEPCIMCSYVIRHHKIPKIVFGLSVNNIGGVTSEFNILETSKIPNWSVKPEILEGICKAECEKITQRFISNKENEQK